MFDAAGPAACAGVALELPWTEPLAAFAAFADEPNICFLLSQGSPGPRARYSYLCIDPAEVLRDATLDALAAALAPQRCLWPGAPVPFAGGAAGF